MADPQFRESVTSSFKKVQNEICTALSAETNQNYQEDIWTYDKGDGGGITRIFQGDVIEKGGVNYSGLSGVLSEKIAGKLQKGGSLNFFATGVSLVIHPLNPFVPTIHMNIRYIERGGKHWFGGGIDLTPFYPDENDIIYFHRCLKSVCDAYNTSWYSEFKQQCDDYFFIKHRNESRGIGGIFFDYLSDDFDKTFHFTLDVGKSFCDVYLPILNKHKNDPWDENNRQFQLYRRGRYVEFNLVYDRGTLFGLETQGRIESILMSLPPLTAWTYNWSPDQGSPESRLYDVLEPRDWASMN